MHLFGFHYPVATVGTGERIFYTDNILLIESDPQALTLQETEHALSVTDQPDTLTLEHTDNDIGLQDTPDTLSITDDPDHLC